MSLIYEELLWKSDITLTPATRLIHKPSLCYKGYVGNETSCGSFFEGHLSCSCGNLSSVLLAILRGTREGQVTFFKDKDR